MGLTVGAISGIVVACVVALLIIIGVLYYLIKRRKENGEYQDRCNRLWKKYGNRSESGSYSMASFPHADPSFVRTPVPGQQFTSRELDQGFVIPGKSIEERQTLLTMNTPINPEDLDPNLYTSESKQGSGATDSSRSGGSHPPQVYFSLNFDESSNVLKVFIERAKHLRPSIFASTCDPYCVVSLLPGQQNERRSQVQRRTVDPVFQEEFSFQVLKEQIKDSLIQIKFFEYDQFSHNDCIGIVLQRLDEVELTKKVDLWRVISLTTTGQLSEKAGDILLRLGYLPSAEKLTVVLLKARFLKEVIAETEAKPPDPYIRVSIFHDGNLLKKKKTSTKKGTCNPTYNQAINFAIPLHVLPQVEIHFTVVHETGVKISRSEAKEVIGTLEIGPHSSGDEKDHWRDLMSNKPQARWHHLTVKTSSTLSPVTSAKTK